MIGQQTEGQRHDKDGTAFVSSYANEQRAIKLTSKGATFRSLNSMEMTDL